MENPMEYVKCGICGSDDYKILFKGLKPEEGIQLNEKYSASSYNIGNDQVVKCNKCGLMYVNPRLKADAIVQGYSDAEDEKYVSQAEGRLSTFKHGLKLVDKYHPQKGKILDVGCAAGFFLKVAKDAGWDTYGVEPSKWSVDWGNKKYGLKMVSGTLKGAKFNEDFFDVVTFWDVLEHVPDPKSDLLETNRIMKDGGLLVVNFPNIGSKLAKLAGKKWWFLLSVHLFYFTPQTIKELLKRCGFETIKIQRHWQTLALGYLVFRVKPYSKILYSVLNTMVNLFGIKDLPIKYYASQSVVIAKKVRDAE